MTTKSFRKHNKTRTKKITQFSEVYDHFILFIYSFKIHFMKSLMILIRDEREEDKCLRYWFVHPSVCVSVSFRRNQQIIHTCSAVEYHYVTSVKSSNIYNPYLQLSSLNSLGTFLLSFSSELTTLKCSCLESPRSSKIKLSVVTITAPTRIKS